MDPNYDPPSASLKPPETSSAGKVLFNQWFADTLESDEEGHKSAEATAAFLLQQAAGLDIDSDHGSETPRRFVQLLRDLTTPPDIKWKTFPAEDDEMITVRDIPFVSLCNHHIVPFMGVAHVGYVPRLEIVGLSKLPRVVEHFARKLQVQERLTGEIASYLMENLDPEGVAVVMEAEHLCMSIRGVKVPGAKTRTSAMRGVFADHTKTAKAEFLAWLNGGKT